MNPQTLKLILAAVSMRREIKLVMGVFFAILLLPVVTVLLATQIGLNQVSNVLASINPITAFVDIHDPADGTVVDSVSEQVIWPINGNVTADFGVFHMPWSLYHSGIDIAGPTGDPIGAFMKGKVIYAGEIQKGLGRHVKIDHGHHVVSYYGHMDTILVEEGQEVEIGTILGTRGSTGWSTGPHLHFQVNIFGIPVNPRVFLSGNP